MPQVMTSPLSTLGACGLGIRQPFLEDLLDTKPKPINFVEFAPENWMQVGGKRSALLQQYAERYPLVCHGLSLSLGSLAPLDTEFVGNLKRFLDRYSVAFYSEHLSYCSDEAGQLYDLLPIPFTEDAVKQVAKRIRQVQDQLERKIAVENVSYYLAQDGELSEGEFINAVLQEADCLLLLDVNNVYVNSVNHHYDPQDFLASIHKEKIVYLHIAGHWQKQPDLIIDTHGDAIIEPVWQLLKETYQHCGVLPTLVERDNDIPELNEILKEITQLKNVQKDFIGQRS